MLRTAVIGVGHLGKQHARIHAALADEGRSKFAGICDLDKARGDEIGNQYGVPSSSDWRDLISKVEAVSLAVPTESHAEIACELLAEGINVLVEKPIARSVDEADAMVDAARKSGAILQVGHTERFNPAMIALR